MTPLELSPGVEPNSDQKVEVLFADATDWIFQPAWSPPTIERIFATFAHRFQLLETQGLQIDKNLEFHSQTIELAWAELSARNTLIAQLKSRIAELEANPPFPPSPGSL